MVSNSSSGSNGNNSNDPQHQQVLKLIEEKDNIERKIQDFGLILQKNNIGFNEPLVDAEGFPRNDIDVRSVRLARTQIICLQNDRKNIMKAIENGMNSYFQDKQNTPSSSSVRLPPQMRTLALQENLKPFLIVNSRQDNSPGDKAGIDVNDAILKFGSINSTNYKDLHQIGELVKSSQNRQINVTVRRNGTQMELILVPKIWEGQGLLGFKIAAVSN